MDVKSKSKNNKKGYTFNKKSQSNKDGKFTIFTMGGNPVEWLQHLKSLVKPIYGNLYKEMVNRGYCDNYPDAVRDAFNPVDANNLTRAEEIELAHNLSTHTKRQDKVNDLNRAIEENREKLKGLILTTVERELQQKCAARDDDYEDLDIFEFVEFIIHESAQQTSDVNVDTLCAKMQSEIFHHRQEITQNLYEYKEATEYLIEKVNTIVKNHKKDPLLTLVKVSDERAAHIFIDGLRGETYGSLQSDIKSGVALKTIQYPTGISDAYDVVTVWAVARKIDVTRKGPKTSYHRSLEDSSEINMATTQVPIKKKNKTGNKENVNPVAATATVAATAAATARECTFCKGKFHSFQECPKAIIMREFDKLGIKSVEQVKALSASKDKEVKKVTMYSRANEEDIDHIEVACMTVVQSESDDDTDSLPNLIDDLSDDEDDDVIDEQSFMTTPVESNKVPEKEKKEKGNLAEMLRSGPYAGLDNMSTVTMVNNREIILKDSIKTGRSIKIDSLLGSSVSSETAELLWGGERVSFSENALATIFAETETLSKYHHELVTHARDDNTPKLIGYDVEFMPGIIVQFRRYGGCMIGNLTPLIEACTAINLATMMKGDGKSTTTSTFRVGDPIQLLSTKNLKNAVASTRIQEGLMIRPKHLQHCIRGGFWTRTGLTAEDVMRAEYLKDVADEVKIGNFHKAQQKLRAKHSYRLDNECIGNKVTAVCDVIFYKGVAFLACMLKPSTMLWAAYLGINTIDEIKSMPVLRDKFIKFFAFVKRGGYVLSTIASDPESAVNALFTTQTTFMSEDTSFVPFPKGHKDGLFEKKIGYLKEHVKFQEEKLASKVNISLNLLKCVVILACFIVNIMPTSTNVNHAPPLFVWSGGKPIDYQRIFGKTTGLELVEANIEDSTKGALTYTSISLYPTNLEGSWKHYNIRTGDTFDREHFERAKWTDDYRRIINETTTAENARVAARVTAAAEHKAELDERRINREEKKATIASEKAARAEVRAQKKIVKTIRSPPRTMLTKNSKISNLQAPTKLKGGDLIALPMHSRTNLLHDFAFATQMNFRSGVKKHGDAAMKVMEKEIAGIDSRKTWEPVYLKDLSNSQRSKIVQAIGLIAEKHKLNADDVLDLVLKGRLCADGRREDVTMFAEGDLAAPTVKTLSLFSTLSLAAAKNMKMMTFDIGQAFLNAEIENEVYVRLDSKTAEILIAIRPEYEKFKTAKGELILKLLKALYGTREAAKLWYDHFKGILESYGYKVSEMDKCVFYKANADGTGKSILLLHVDDGLVFADNDDILQQLVVQLDKSFEGKFTWNIDDPIKEYLGMQMEQSPGQIKLTMEKYINDLCLEYKISTNRRVPANSDLFDIDKTLPMLPDENRKHLHTGIAKLLFLACRVRPDILCSVIFLCRRVKYATEQDYFKFANVLKYLHATSKLGLILGGDSNGVLHLNVYADAAHAVNDNSASQTGIYATLGRGAIFSKSMAQNYIARASYDAEAYAMSDAIPTGLWVQDFMTELGYGNEVNPGKLMEDNMSLIHSIKRGETTSATQRHIRIRSMFTRQFIESGKFELVHCKTKAMIADMLTKPLQGELFETLRDLILGYSMP